VVFGRTPCPAFFIHESETDAAGRLISQASFIKKTALKNPAVAGLDLKSTVQAVIKINHRRT
jgi:hypothetical protein